jgi:hypothetical protein
MGCPDAYNRSPRRRTPWDGSINVSRRWSSAEFILFRENGGVGFGIHEHSAGFGGIGQKKITFVPAVE